MEGLILRSRQKSRLTFAELHLCCPAVVSISLRRKAKLEKQTQNLSSVVNKSKMEDYLGDGLRSRRYFSLNKTKTWAITKDQLYSESCY